MRADGLQVKSTPTHLQENCQVENNLTMQESKTVSLVSSAVDSSIEADSS